MTHLSKHLSKLKLLVIYAASCEKEMIFSLDAVIYYTTKTSISNELLKAFSETNSENWAFEMKMGNTILDVTQ